MYDEQDLTLENCSASHLALNEELAKKYLLARKADADNLSNLIKQKNGNLDYAKITYFVSADHPARLVNGHWCDSYLCALAFILATWW